MILIDFSQTIIAGLMAQLKANDGEMSEDLLRHMIINSLRNYQKRYAEEYGEMVLCTDAVNPWRRDFYPHYKAGRKKARDNDDMDWGLIFDTLHKVKMEIKENFPYRYMYVENSEADDIIAVLTKESKEPVLIVSGDKDFQQLQRYSKVKQYSPITKKNIKLTREQAEEYLVDHIIGGDTGDGVPNVLSQDDVFVSGLRQRPLSKKKRETIKDPLVMNDNEIDRNLQRNRSLIDLTYIPNEYKKQILHEFDNVEVASRAGLLTYFINNRLMDLQESIGDF